MSTTAAEALATNDSVSEMVYIRAVLMEMFGNRFEELPMVLNTDSKNLWKAVSTTALVEDPRLRLDLAVLKQSLEIGEIDELNLVSGKDMIADSLTKKGASVKKLMSIIQTGKMAIEDRESQ